MRQARPRADIAGGDPRGRCRHRHRRAHHEAVAAHKGRREGQQRYDRESPEVGPERPVRGGQGLGGGDGHGDVQPAGPGRERQSGKAVEARDPVEPRSLAGPFRAAGEDGLDHGHAGHHLPDPGLALRVAGQDAPLLIHHREGGAARQKRIGREVVEPAQVHGGEEHRLDLAAPVQGGIRKGEARLLRHAADQKLAHRELASLERAAEVGAVRHVQGPGQGNGAAHEFAVRPDGPHVGVGGELLLDFGHQGAAGPGREAPHGRQLGQPRQELARRLDDLVLLECGQIGEVQGPLLRGSGGQAPVLDAGVDDHRQRGQDGDGDQQEEAGPEAADQRARLLAARAGAGRRQHRRCGRPSGRSEVPSPELIASPSEFTPTRSSESRDARGEPARLRSLRGADATLPPLSPGAGWSAGARRPPAPRDRRRRARSGPAGSRQAPAPRRARSAPGRRWGRAPPRRGPRAS